jgi:hypothetical protein
MIDTTIINTTRQLKKELDAAYLVFKKKPTTDNAATWNAATIAFKDFCVKTIESLIEDTGASNKEQEILANLEEYKTCKQCGAELLYPTNNHHYVASSDFLEDFPGWCYCCLEEHCVKTDCESCKVAADPATCSFKEVKKLALQGK